VRIWFTCLARFSAVLLASVAASFALSPSSRTGRVWAAGGGGTAAQLESAHISRLHISTCEAVSAQTRRRRVACGGEVAALAPGLARSWLHVWVVLPSTSASMLAAH
jgi:hypothetical protein